MRKAFALMLLTATAGVVAPPAAAQRVNVAAEGWTLDAGNLRCSLARRSGGGESPVLVLSSYLGSDAPELMVMRGGSQALPDTPSIVNVVLQPSNQTAAGRVRMRQMQGGRVIQIEGLGESFIDRFADARSVRIAGRGRTLLDIATPGARRAVAALKSCNNELLQSWGVDTGARSTFRQQARRVSGGFTDADYPSSWTQGRSGTVVARFRVNPDGSVSDCAVAVSSNSPDLDQATCAVIARRYRYDPAMDAEGRRVGTVEVQTINWLNPR